jgi:hypothetical protein
MGQRAADTFVILFKWHRSYGITSGLNSVGNTGLLFSISKVAVSEAEVKYRYCLCTYGSSSSSIVATYLCKL